MVQNTEQKLPNLLSAQHVLYNLAKQYQWDNLLKYLQFHYNHHKHLQSDLPPDT